MPEEQVRLTQLTHGGGGGCKVAPDILEKILSGIKPGIIPPQLLSGRENSDDAAVYGDRLPPPPPPDDEWDTWRLAEGCSLFEMYRHPEGPFRGR